MNDERGVPGRRTGRRPLRPVVGIPPQAHSGTVSRGAMRPRRGGTAAGSWLLLVGAAVAATVAVAWVFGATGDGTTGGASVTPRAAMAGTGQPSLEPTLGSTVEPLSTASPRTTVEPPSSATTPTPVPTEPSIAGPPFEEEPTEALPVRLVIDSPIDGQVLAEPFVVVVGRAPADAPITRDIRLWFDEHTVAGPGGSWTMRVGLAPGGNELRFRIGDDATTARTIHVIYEPPT